MQHIDLPHYSWAGWSVQPEKMLPLSVVVVGFVAGAVLALAVVV